MKLTALKISLATRIMSGAILSIVITATIFIYSIVKSERELYLVDQNLLMSNRVLQNITRLELAINSLRSDVLFLSETYPIQGIIMGVLNEDQAEQEIWKSRLLTIFKAFTQSRPSYFQIRFIGVADNGRELVRVDMNGGELVVIKPEELQQKGHRDYFKAVINMQPGQVYLSEINLNREFGEVQIPHIPTLRAVTPVFGSDGMLFGMVTINLDMSDAFKSATRLLSPGMLAYLTNDQGDYLVHPVPGRTFGFDLGHRYTRQQDLPGMQDLPATDSGHIPLQAIASPDGILHVVSQKLNFDPLRPDRYILLAYGLPDVLVKSQIQESRNSTVIGTTIIALIILGFVYLFLRQSFAPLTSLSNQVRKIGDGHYNVDLPKGTSGEMEVFVLAFGNMLTGIRKREQQIREGEERANLIVETIPDGILVLGESFRIVNSNSHLETIFGYSKVDLVNQPVNKLFPESMHQRCQGLCNELMIQQSGQVMGKNVEIIALHNDGHEFPVEVSLARLSREGRQEIIFCIRDISELKQAESRFRSVVEAASSGMIMVDSDGMIVLVNSLAEKLFGYTRDQLIGKPIELLIPDHIRGSHAALRTRFIENPEMRAMGAGRDLRGMREDNSEFPLEIGLNPIQTDEGNFVLANIVDITQRRHSEQRIKSQLDHLNLLDQITRAISERMDLTSIFKAVVSNLLENLPIDYGAICQFNQAEKVITINYNDAQSGELVTELARTGNEKFLIDENELLDICIKGELIYKPDISVSKQPFPAWLANAGLKSLVLAPMRTDEQVFGVMVAARNATDSFNSIDCEFLRQLCEHIALATNQTQLYSVLQNAYDDLRHSQQTILQQEQLRALGQMSSGIAHDINNAISPIALYTESMLENETGLSEKSREYLLIIQQAIDDVALTVSRMGEFYKQREPDMELANVNLNQIVEHATDLTRARWCDMAQQQGLDIELNLELLPGLPAIMGVKNEIRGALINLIFNAVDAMPEGGSLTIRTRMQEKSPEYTSQVVVEVIDSGVGMDNDTRNRCLEPFYTTKGERGTGLGLGMVYGVIKRHSADMQIDSTPGEGTTVRLLFPTPAEVLLDEPKSSEAIITNNLRILIIDDDPLLIKSIHDVLTSDGHMVTAAAGGQAGIDEFQIAHDQNNHFDVVISDLGMPQVDGSKVAQSIKMLSPDTPIILLTGWGQRFMDNTEKRPPVDYILSKPPRQRELREVLAKCCQPVRTIN